MSITLTSGEVSVSGTITLTITSSQNFDFGLITDGTIETSVDMGLITQSVTNTVDAGSIA